MLKPAAGSKQKGESLEIQTLAAKIPQPSPHWEQLHTQGEIA